MDDDPYVACSQTVAVHISSRHTRALFILVVVYVWPSLVWSHAIRGVYNTSSLDTGVSMSHHVVVVLALFSYVHVANSDLSRIQTYPSHQRVHPSPGRPTGRIPPLPAAPLPNYVLMTAASTGDFEPDNDLEVTHEFKIRVDAANEMCMFQKVRQNSRLYFSFKVRPFRCEFVGHSFK